VCQPRNILSPLIHTMDFDEDHEIDQGEDGEDGENGSFDPSSFPETSSEFMNNFAVLDTSLPFSVFPERQIESASYPSTTIKHLAATVSPIRERGKPAYHGHRRMRWHFGIRSQSPPMEVMLEIYRTLHALGMDWKEKRDLGGLGGVPRSTWDTTEGDTKKKRIQRCPEMDGNWREDVDFKTASDIYFVEARARVHEIVVRRHLSFCTLLLFNMSHHLFRS
jgi:carbon catabolite-derepressing protein kinase